jgi:hypothetical protein
MEAKVGRLNARWSHLFAGPDDDLGDLHDLAERIGLRRAWFQDKQWPMQHYDVTDPKRLAAIGQGAQPITWRQTGEMMHQAITARYTQTARAAELQGHDIDVRPGCMTCRACGLAALEQGLAVGPATRSRCTGKPELVQVSLFA